MKVVVAVDSFKGSMTSMEAGMAVKAGILAAKKDAEVIVKPLADGGEGTTDALIEGLKGERVDVTVTGPYHEPVQAYYGYLRESNTAVMEMATAAGITLSDKKEPMIATTYGVGELILHAISRGIRNFIIGIGGSATNDGGVGMLRALGYRFLDEKGEDAGEGGQALARIASVEISDKKELLSQCNFRIACDELHHFIFVKIYFTGVAFIVIIITVVYTIFAVYCIGHYLLLSLFPAYFISIRYLLLDFLCCLCTCAKFAVSDILWCWDQKIFLP